MRGGAIGRQFAIGGAARKVCVSGQPCTQAARTPARQPLAIALGMHQQPPGARHHQPIPQANQPAETHAGVRVQIVQCVDRSDALA